MGRITGTNVLFLELCLNYVQVLKMCGKAIDIHQCNARTQRTRVCVKTTCYAVGFGFCARHLELFDYLSAAKRLLSEQRCQNDAKLDRHNGAAKNVPSWKCRNSAAKFAANWARLTILAASMVHIYQTCSKYG